jgi:hypothetical protein
MTPYWLSIEVRLSAPLALLADDGESKKAELIGFVQELACTAEDEERAKAQIRAHVERYDLGTQTALEIMFLSVEEIDPESLDSLQLDGRERMLADPRSRGVWFETSRSFWSE